MNKDELINEITEHELEMFLATPNDGGPAECQQRPEAFKFMRHMAHSAHSEEFLKSYLEDLCDAEKMGRNLMVEKYARMDNRIPPLNDSPLLDEIADAEIEYLEEAASLYPDIIKAAGHDNFRNYLRCELETLSQRSLQLYADEIARAKEEGRNPVLERHNWLASRLGKPLLE